MEERGVVHIADDDSAMRESIRLLVEAAGLRAVCYAAGADLLAAELGDDLGCVVLDLRMTGLDGLAVQRELRRRGNELPVILITAYGDVAAAVEAMRGGALDFLEKPFPREVLLSRITQALEHQRRLRRTRERRAAAEALFAHLSPREQSVARALLAGRNTKQAAAELGISPKTVDNHRASIFAKAHVDSVSQLLLALLPAFPELAVGEAPSDEPPPEESRPAPRDALDGCGAT